ncbi:MAG: DinB family protein [Armatimonadetes bacterium]|nr:DinB family protein [Armatimonadota bacterium]
MAGTHDLLKARFAHVRRDLDRVLDRLVEADMRWTPAQGMRTVASQLVEIADKERETLVWVQTGVWPDDDPPTFDEETVTLAEARVALARLRKATYAFIDGQTEAELERPVANPEGWYEALGLLQCPLSEVLRTVAAHEWYHTGQLVMYLWSRGEDPYAW